MNSSYSINSERSFDIFNFLSFIWSKKSSSKTKTTDSVISIETKGIHPKYIEIVDEGQFIVVKGLNINNLNTRLCNVIKKSDYSYLDLDNIGYRAGKIIIGVKK